MIHYELFIYFMLGWKPKDLIRRFGFARGTTYRMYRNYRTALKIVGQNSKELFPKVFRCIEKTQQNLIIVPFPVSPEREKKVNTLGY